MQIEIIIGLGLNALMFFLQFLNMKKQTDSLAKQTDLLSNNIRYESYLKQVEQLNIINQALIDKDALAEIFANLEGFQDILERFSMSEIGFAWLLINRYESAYVGHRLGVIPPDEWDVWKNRMRKGLGHKVVKEIWKSDLEGFDYARDFRKVVNNVLAGE